MNTLLKILKDIRPECNFQESKDFFEDGLLDSFDLMALVSELDKKYNISIDGMDIIPENFNTVESIKILLNRNGVEL
jgi:acyl carrier protein